MENKRDKSLLLKKSKNNKGISIIALVITIIVILILAAIVIGTLEDHGLLGKAKEAKTKYNQGVTTEEKRLNEAFGGALSGATYYVNGDSDGDVSVKFENGKLLLSYTDEDSDTHEERTYTSEYDYKVEDGVIYVKYSGSGSNGSDSWEKWGTTKTLTNGTEIIIYEESGMLLFATGPIEDNTSINLSGTYTYSYTRQKSSGDSSETETITYNATFGSGRQITVEILEDSPYSFTETYYIYDDIITVPYAFVGTLNIVNGEVVSMTINGDPDEDPLVFTKK